MVLHPKGNGKELQMSQTAVAEKVNLVSLPDAELEAIRLPGGAKPLVKDGLALAAINSIVGIAQNLFDFRENSGTPGRLLEQVVPIGIPPGATGFFTMIPYFTGAFTNGDFTRLAERPLGQYFVQAGLRGTDMVCRVRLTDSNADDPIFIQARVLIVFFN
jgi:hypothetical protein